MKSQHNNVAVLITLILFLGFGCVSSPEIDVSRSNSLYVSEDSVLLRETTVAQVNGYSVGSGNYFLRENNEGKEEMSIQLSIWTDDTIDGEEIHKEVFLGDVVDVGDKKYMLVLVKENISHINEALLVLVLTTK